MRSRPLTRVPSNVHVVESVPHGAVLPHVDLAITHGGHGTLIRALACGVPVMVVPISRDQPDNAARAVHHGVGITVVGLLYLIFVAPKLVPERGQREMTDRYDLRRYLSEALIGA